MSEALDTTDFVVTGTGVKYHLPGCDTLDGRGEVLPIRDPQSAGYTPCGVCQPPRVGTPLVHEVNLTRLASMLVANRAAAKYAAGDVERGAICDRLSGIEDAWDALVGHSGPDPAQLASACGADLLAYTTPF